jgi:competence protein ComEA
MKKGGKMKRRFSKIVTCIVAISILVVPIYVMAGEKVNLNTATVEELSTLKGVGPSIAQRIIDYREKYGPFETIEDLMKVKGIGSKTFDANKDIITVE